MMFITNHICKWLTIFLCLCNYLSSTTSIQILHKQLQLEIQKPKQTINKMPLTISVIQQQQNLSISLPEVNFEIASNIYVNGGPLDEDKLFNKNLYQAKVSNNCKLLSTDVERKIRTQVKFEEDIEVFNYYLSHKYQDKKSTLYIISTNSIIYKYIFDKINIKLSGTYQVNTLNSLKQENRLSSNIQLLQISSTLFVFSNQSAYILDERNIINHFAIVDGYKPVDRLVAVGVIQENQTSEVKIIWVCGGNVIYIYHVNMLSQNIFSLQQINKLSGFTNNIIQSITYNQNDKYFYLTSGTNLYIINSTVNSISPIQAYNVNTICNKISLTGNVLYLSCKYERVYFIQQLILKPKVIRGEADRYPYEDIKLNRYYDDYLLEGIRDVEELGYNRVALIGDQEVIIISKGVNRNILLNLEENRNKKQFYQRVFSLGMIEFFYLSQYSTSQQSRILVLTEDKLSLLSIYYNPPEIQCKFSRKQFGLIATVLVSISISCPSSAQFQDISTYRMCQSLYPYQIIIGQKQYEKKTTLLILISFILLGISLIMVCIGYGIKFKKKADIILDKLKNKLMQKKKKRQLKNFPISTQSI